ncbi:MAG: amidohydrolase family protein [Planctomycetota bacterium]|nr:amidohydrolase family protein [Planctomycetota bacterium]
MGVQILLALAAISPAPTWSGSGTVVLRAGSVHVVEGGRVIENGAVILRDGKIVAVGADLAVPPGARVVDYGPDAVLTPGLVAADSNYGAPRPDERSADPFLRALDNFDPYASYVFALQEGVTTAYLAPARNRLIAGVGAVVKLAGEADVGSRLLLDPSSIHGSLGLDARNSPGYWKPPIPATADVGMGVVKQELPRSLAGAVVAFRELFALAQGSAGAPAEDEYGAGVGEELRGLMSRRVPWRITADSAPEIRALVDLFSKNGQAFVVDGANEAADVAKELAEAGASVIVDAPITPNRSGQDRGKDPEARWPRFDAAAKLAEAGVRFAIAPPQSGSASDLRLSAQLLSRGGLDPEIALRAITLSAAEILGVGDRVGSLTPGKDADIAVFSGHPLQGGAVLATWVAGEIAFDVEDLAHAGAFGDTKDYAPPMQSATVIQVEELHVGDGTVYSPGEVLVEGGKIRAVGKSVGRPSGARVVRGAAAMPGMIDALGYLGLEGSQKVPATRFDMSRIVEPGDRVDRMVAKAGVTTVALSPRGPSRTGAPMMAYKPAGDDLETMIVDATCALRFTWTERNRRESGAALIERLKKAVEYAKRWDEYETKLASWTPPKADAAADADATGEKKADSADSKDGEKKEESAEAKEGEKKDGDKKDAEADKKKDKKKKGEEEPAKPISGAWESKVTLPPFQEARIRLYVLDEEGAVSGSLRCASLSDALIQVSGKRDGHKVDLRGEGTRGTVTLVGETKEGKLKAKVSVAGSSADVEFAQTATEYEVARPAELRKPKEVKKAEIKGEPKAPSLDPELEPLRRAIAHEAAVLVEVNREDEIRACVDAFEAAGIRPILYGAEEAWKVADEIKDRVAGILPQHDVVRATPETGARKRNRYAELVAAGIPIAFHSAAEEGAVDLPLMAAYAVSQGLGSEAALRALTWDAARMLAIGDRVGMLAPGMDADILLLDGSPLSPSSSVLRVWVAGREIR